MNEFNQEEFLKICKKLETEPYYEHIVLNYENSNFFNKMKNSVMTDRRGEVVFCVIRPNKKIITVTCEGYPNGIFRIPTGGLGHNEDIIEGVFREAKEELGIDVEISRLTGVQKIEFQHNDEKFMFYSYIFILKEIGGRLLVDASDDEVSEVREVDLDGLDQIVCSLANIPGTWNDWGKFRFVTSKAVLNYLKQAEELMK